MSTLQAPSNSPVDPTLPPSWVLPILFAIYFGGTPGGGMNCTGSITGDFAVMACDDEVRPSQERIETAGDLADVEQIL